MGSRSRYSKWVAILVAWLVLAAGTVLEGEKQEVKKKGVSVLKLIPGAFQVKQKKYFKGGILLGAFGAAVTLAVIENHKGNDFYEQYRASQDVDEVVALRKQTEKHLKRRNIFIVGASAVWLVHLLDLKLFKGDKGGIKGEITDKNIRIGIYYSF